MKMFSKVFCGVFPPLMHEWNKLSITFLESAHDMEHLWDIRCLLLVIIIMFGNSLFLEVLKLQHCKVQPKVLQFHKASTSTTGKLLLTCL